VLLLLIPHHLQSEKRGGAPLGHRRYPGAARDRRRDRHRDDCTA